jgi:hypothetical protein
MYLRECTAAKRLGVTPYPPVLRMPDVGAFPAFLLSSYVLIALHVDSIAQAHHYEVFANIGCQSPPTHL